LETAPSVKKYRNINSLYYESCTAVQNCLVGT
jgi:hypothetical protein